MPATTPNYLPPIGTATIPATGTLTSPQSPSGASPLATNYAQSWNFVNGKLAVQADLNTDKGPQQGTPMISNTASISLAGVPAGALAVFRWQ
jgi:hypothetical protein